MTTIKEIIQILEQAAPLSLQESYDNSGLVLGNESAAVSGVLVALDCTEQVLDEALSKGCNLVITHHPLIFSGIKKLAGRSYVERTILKAIQSGLAVYSMHTNLDNTLSGVNNKIAEKLGLQILKLLLPKRNLLRKLVTFCPSANTEVIRRAMFDAGAGNISNYSECSFTVSGFGTFKGNDCTNPYLGKPNMLQREKEDRLEVIYPAHVEEQLIAALINAHPYEEVAYDCYELQNNHTQVGSGMIGQLPEAMTETAFLQHLKTQFHTGCIRHSKLLNRKVSTVAVCGGSGSFLVPAAIKAKADFFVTADLKYHQFFDADHKIVLADIGHYESEQFTTEIIRDLLVNNFSTFAVHLSIPGTNPVCYF